MFFEHGRFIKFKIMKQIKLSALSIIFFLSCITSNAQPIIQWQKCLGGSMGDVARSVIQTSDGGYIVAGFTNSHDGNVTGSHDTVASYTDYWVVKLNSSGNLQWQKCLGGTDEDRAFSIAEAREGGGYIIAGYAFSNDGDVTGNHGMGDYWVVKLDTAGNIQWQKCLGGTSPDYAYSVKQTIDGGYIITGTTGSNDGDVSGLHDTTGNGNCGPDYWVVKLDASGNIKWQKCLGGNNYDESFSINQTFDGGYIVAGYAHSTDGDITGNHGGQDYWVVKLDSLGTIQWQKSLGGSGGENAYSVQQTNDKGYIVAGFTGSSNGDVTVHYGSVDYWVVKLDSAGNLQWQKTLGGIGADEAYSLWQCVDGGYIVAGLSSSNNYDVSGNHGGPDDYWIAKLDTIGNIQWQKCLGGSGYDVAYSIQQTVDGCYIMAGVTESNDGDVSGNHGAGDFWVVKLCYVVGTDEITINNNGVNIFPNPTDGKFTVEIKANTSGKYEIEIYNITGEKVYSANTNENTIDIDLTNYARGLYFVRVRNDRFVKAGKVILE
jgi:hypothetical protein